MISPAVVILFRIPEKENRSKSEEDIKLFVCVIKALKEISIFKVFPNSIMEEEISELIFMSCSHKK